MSAEPPTSDYTAAVHSSSRTATHTVHTFTDTYVRTGSEPSNM